jgi:CRISPR-associated endonuclease/helicase Cas3
MDTTLQFREFFHSATGFPPYEWQIRIAEEGLPGILPVPTGLGKTEGAVLAWAWRRLVAKKDEPLHREEKETETAVGEDVQDQDENEPEEES